ncbi:MAG: hypothetical protein FWH21_07930 [Kiritimatiellaeota bacterium]|nr:hypothetical protein [Kiritimatiellota bacterium]
MKTPLTKIYVAVLAVMLATGFALLAWSIRYPWNTVPDEEIYNRVFAKVARDDYEQNREQWKQCYQEREKLYSPRKRMNDGGLALIAFAAILGCLFAATRFPLPGARTPLKKWKVFALFLGAIGSQFPLCCFFLIMEQNRFAYHPSRDTIILGMISSFIGCIATSLVGSLIFGVILAFAKLPAPLWVWSSRHKYVSLFVTILFGIPVAFFVFLLSDTLWNGEFPSVICLVILIYLLLSMRAGIIEKRRVEKGSEKRLNT